MKETGIIMSGNHPKLILDGIKTMTRRVINLKGYSREIWDSCVPHNGEDARLLGEPYLKVPYDRITDNAGNRITCPYGQVGDRLWVRETLIKSTHIQPVALYKVDDCPVMGMSDDGLTHLVFNWQWQKDTLPSIFMPRWASRITLEITGLRAERLQEITLTDAQREGFSRHNPIMAKVQFINTWDSLNAKRDYGWDTYCWVWVIGFKLLNS